MTSLTPEGVAEALVAKYGSRLTGPVEEVLGEGSEYSELWKVRQWREEREPSCQ